MLPCGWGSGQRKAPAESVAAVNESTILVAAAILVAAVFAASFATEYFRTGRHWRRKTQRLQWENERIASQNKVLQEENHKLRGRLQIEALRHAEQIENCRGMINHQRKQMEIKDKLLSAVDKK